MAQRENSKTKRYVCIKNINHSSLLGGRHPQVLRCYYDEQLYGEVGKEKKENGSCAVERGGTEEAEVVRNRLTRVA